MDSNLRSLTYREAENFLEIANGDFRTLRWKHSKHATSGSREKEARTLLDADPTLANHKALAVRSHIKRNPF